MGGSRVDRSHFNKGTKGCPKRDFPCSTGTTVFSSTTTDRLVVYRDTGPGSLGTQNKLVLEKGASKKGTQQMWKVNPAVYPHRNSVAEAATFIVKRALQNLGRELVMMGSRQLFMWQPTL